ncbi:penicillin acylase family protein [Jiulongibacter sediminis]|nr:penicillin acylase family protein [Jiulongibacter sediminis]
MIKKVILGLLALIILGLAGVCAYLQYLQPSYSGELKIENLKAPVEVIYDDYAIPHVYAQNEDDLFRAFGYVHAQDRLFQMELLRRLSGGRLSEVFGEAALETDLFFRTLNFKKHAAEAIADRSPDSSVMRAAEAYIDGVNQYLKNGKTPIEFTLAGIPKAEFTVNDIEMIIAFMGYTFEGAFQSEAVLTYLQNTYGPEYIKDFDQSWPDGDYQLPVDKKAQIEVAKSLALVSQKLQEIDKDLAIKPFNGSNGWVISGQRTKSGKPILSNDTHIAYSQPAIWYEAHLSCPTFEVYGNFLAGTPLPALGHNPHGGWGLTMFENDEADFYREKSNPENPNQVWYKDQWVDLEIQEEVIKIKGGKDTTIQIRKSPHGYLLNGAFTDLKEHSDPIALQWVYHLLPSKHADVFYGLCTAKNVQEAEEAVQHLTSPGLNFMWADKEGNIAWWAAGKLPIRPDHVNSYVILDGSAGDDDWQGFYNFAYNPQLVNPEKGYLYTANNQPENMGTGKVPGYYVPSNRAKRILELIGIDKTDWSEESLREVINDNISSTYPPLIDSLLSVIDKNSLSKNAQNALPIIDNWKGEHELKSTAPALYYRWVYEMYERAMRDELGEDYFKDFEHSHAFKRGMRTFFLNDKSPWWDDVNTSQKETREQVFTESFEASVTFLENQLGTDQSQWHWEKVHTLEHPHAMGQVEALKKYFNLGPLPAPGGLETIDNQMFLLDSTGYYKVVAGPALRRIIDFATPDKAYSVLPTGQSGYFMNDHYDDQAKMFVNGGKRPELMNRADIEKAQIGRLILKP